MQEFESFIRYIIAARILNCARIVHFAPGPGGRPLFFLPARGLSHELHADGSYAFCLRQVLGRVTQYKLLALQIAPDYENAVPRRYPVHGLAVWANRFQVAGQAPALPGPCAGFGHCDRIGCVIFV